ncbi:NACHT domain-containing NTPase [Chroococcidiopsis sp. TS-821]|uniref:NACHT domain-containing protein n=1 Tax=Chroococcidiopsis sp. TS-821 TaxID=1378066 RepID=UPI000CED8229|nr:hypothetical protein [Chroococcidiopsis sp. TS-821]PPS45686.1 hypothetical protein B1A85_05435 [Chroococcidiopsis sp. TS-821]
MLNVTIESQFQKISIDNYINIDEQKQIGRQRIWFRTQQPQLPVKIQEHESLKQIISQPLLLTFLRVVFAETGEIPPQRSQLYHAGLQILLKRWHSSKDAKDEILASLSLKQKEDLLTYVAWMTFAQGEYFFKQQQLEQYISDYLQKIFTNQNETETREQAKQVLQSIQAHYGLFTEWTPGIYAFSVLSFHEYLAAKAIVEGYTAQGLEQALKHLVEQLTESRWHQICTLVASMLPNTDYLLLLLKHKIDTLIESQATLQPFLSWLEHQSMNINFAYKPAAIRAFYIECILGRDFEISGTLDSQLSRDLEADSPKLNSAINNIQRCRFSDRQKLALQQYYELSKVLFDSIDAGCVTCSVRDELEQNLFSSEKNTLLLEAIA